MGEFVSFIVTHLVDNPTDVAVELEETESALNLRLRVSRQDVGKVIGRHGRTAQALRTLLTAAAARKGKRASLDIIE